MINQYIYKNNNRNKGIIGALVAAPIKGTEHYGIGWSLCHPNDRKSGYSKKAALNIAKTRAESKFLQTEYDYGERKSEPVQIPYTVQKHLDHFKANAKKYFKQLTLMEKQPRNN